MFDQGTLTFGGEQPGSPFEHGDSKVATWKIDGREEFIGSFTSIGFESLSQTYHCEATFHEKNNLGPLVYLVFQQLSFGQIERLHLGSFVGGEQVQEHSQWASDLGSAHVNDLGVVGSIRRL